MKPHGQWSVWAHLTLKRRSLATISPSLRHPLLLDLSSTSHSLRTSGSFSRLTLVDRSAQSDMATSGGTLSSRPLTTIKSRTRRLLPGRHTYRFGFSPHTRTHTHTHTRTHAGPPAPKIFNAERLLTPAEEHRLFRVQKGKVFKIKAARRHLGWQLWTFTNRPFNCKQTNFSWILTTWGGCEKLFNVTAPWC